MAAQNIFEKSYITLSASEPCVFISHSTKDKSLARAVANALLSMSINIYFDENDKILQQVAHLGIDEAIVKCIDDGLDHSTHLLGLITHNTKVSWWVPYEIGGARGRKKECAHLISNEVTEVPSFIKVGKIILDIIDLTKWVGEIVRLDRFKLKETLSKSLYFSSLTSMLPESRATVNFI